MATKKKSRAKTKTVKSKSPSKVKTNRTKKSRSKKSGPKKGSKLNLISQKKMKEMARAAYLDREHLEIAVNKLEKMLRKLEDTLVKKLT